MKSFPNNVTGANAGRARGLNRRIVLGQVKSAQGIGRAEIARATGLTTQTVSNIISELEQDEFLIETGRRTSGRGLPAVLYSLNPCGGYSFGVEVRPDALFLSLMDLTGRELQTHHEVLDATEPVAVLGRIEAAKDRILNKSDVRKDRLLGFGIVMPGPFGETGLSESASELPGWNYLNVQDWFSERLGVPVIVENDANAAAMFERVSGVARELDSFAYLYFGAGLGLGLIQSGQLIRGAYGNAGEIGHVYVPGAYGPVMLQNAVSRLSVQSWMASHGIATSSSYDLEMLYRVGDSVLLSWLDQAADALSHAVAMIENMLDPESIVMGGAMPEAMLDRLIERVVLAENSISNRPGRQVPRLMRGGYGRMTAARGAAALVIDRSFQPQIAVDE